LTPAGGVGLESVGLDALPGIASSGFVRRECKWSQASLCKLVSIIISSCPHLDFCSSKELGWLMARLKCIGEKDLSLNSDF
jgi:hypothetical protein